MGVAFQHDVYVMDLHGNDSRKSSNRSNSQGASFSPDGQWIALTAYTDVANKDESVKSTSCASMVPSRGGSPPISIVITNRAGESRRRLK